MEWGGGRRQYGAPRRQYKPPLYSGSRVLGQIGAIGSRARAGPGRPGGFWSGRVVASSHSSPRIPPMGTRGWSNRPPHHLKTPFSSSGLTEPIKKFNFCQEGLH